MTGLSINERIAVIGAGIAQLAAVANTLKNIQASYAEERYRVSPLLLNRTYEY